MTTPTPTKQSHGATPTPTHQATIPPGHTSVPMGRGFSQRSVSVKPTLSQRGAFPGSHPLAGPSLSSQGQHGATPLVATLSNEGGAAMMTSPSALLALGLGGMTPPTVPGQDVGLPGIHVGELPPMSVPDVPMTTAGRDVAEERARRLNEALELLRSRVAGRGVCREGIVRLSKHEGLDCMWQGDDLTIAGSSIDLEVEFEKDSDIVKDVTLSYALPSGDIVTREQGAEVLKRDLILSDDERKKLAWKKLDNFHVNVRRLARLDQMSKQISCFDAIECLRDSLRRLWDAESSQRGLKGYYDHICTSTVGEPSMDKGSRIGLSLDYWVSQHYVWDKRRNAAHNEMNIDGQTAKKDMLEPKVWGAVVECEEGFPSLRISRDWVSHEVFVPQAGHDQEERKDSLSNKVVNWLEPPPTMVKPEEQAGMEGGPLSHAQPTPVDRRFVARLDPPIHVPIRTASEIYRLLDVPVPPDLRSSIYDRLVLPPIRQDSAGGAVDPMLHDERLVLRGQPFAKTVYAFDDKGKPVKKRHDYVFHAFEPTMGCTIKDLPFGHPRQLASVIPILRQYALLSNLLERAYSTDDSRDSSLESKQTQQQSPPNEPQPSGYISNINPLRSKVDSLMGINDEAYYNKIDPGRQEALDRIENQRLYSLSHHEPKAEAKRVDISLRTLISGPPSIMLLFNDDSNLASGPRTVTINVTVAINGSIEIADVSGPWDHEFAEDEGVGEELKGKLTDVLKTCEDLSMVVEWVLKWYGERKSRLAAQG